VDRLVGLCEAEMYFFSLVVLGASFLSSQERAVYRQGLARCWHMASKRALEYVVTNQFQSFWPPRCRHLRCWSNPPPAKTRVTSFAPPLTWRQAI